ncbi:hypothetical protein G3M48_006272 [Beauveria asiatica]|uniref:Uncharacterized protein n=1 Tax=Beauveria asiatica TaxID=1069075 RepID=A0AAW0RQL1_9HYPO
MRIVVDGSPPLIVHLIRHQHQRAAQLARIRAIRVGLVALVYRPAHQHVGPLAVAHAGPRAGSGSHLLDAVGEARVVEVLVGNVPERLGAPVSAHARQSRRPRSCGLPWSEMRRCLQTALA